MESKFRKMPVGAEVLPKGGVHFRVWAPRRKSVSVSLEGSRGRKTDPPYETIPLMPETGGYFSGTLPQATEGTLYRFRLDEEKKPYPDPASRFQPEGTAGPSQVIDPSQFEWTDGAWSGVRPKGQIIYEMHIGTFTREGTWEEAARHLPELAAAGMTLLEIMPVAEFPGRFGWGYDGVDLFAPTRLYGTPDDFRRFVNEAHRNGLGVILDVVYNHFGPSDSYFRMYSLDYFTDRYKTEWGEALNFDGENSGPVREFIVSNAVYWIREFHLDGLRLDATQSLTDRSARHIVKVLTKEARRAGEAKSVFIIGENEPQHVRLIRHPADGGFGLDGLWNDDFHHSAMGALTGRREAYYSDYLGTPQELISAAKWGFLYQGQYYSWQKQPRGTPTFGLKPSLFINYVQNHDQIANSARGSRCHALTSPGRYRAMIGFMLLIPGTPMLFQGQEFCASTPFLYFADHEAPLSELVRAGRADFLKQFESLNDPEILPGLPEPSDPETFERCKLDQSERERHAEAYALHRDLLKLRREDPVFRAQRTDWMHGAVLGSESFLLRFLGREEGDRLIIVNLGRDLVLGPASEPLLAPPEDSRWELLWTSEDPRYGGSGTPPLHAGEGWRVTAHATAVLAPKKS